MKTISTILKVFRISLIVPISILKINCLSIESHFWNLNNISTKQSLWALHKGITISSNMLLTLLTIRTTVNRWNQRMWFTFRNWTW